MTAAIREAFNGPLPPIGDISDRPTYCSRCGKLLVYKYEQDSYRPSTGEPIGTPTFRCPTTLGFINRVLLTRHVFHDEYEPYYFFEWSWRKRTYM